ncbi:S-methyl-5'-thioadenosine phosphorylase [Patescibacteria group bacterium]|nr:S-methyl-5'-thioadenosine phosphorylase [Patescibacteria group bacterium]
MTPNKLHKIGIIGGSGLDDPKLLNNIKQVVIKTPYGLPSDNLVTGQLASREVVILARHGKKHTIPPTQIPFRANIWALHKLGCDVILATTACGSLKTKFKPGQIVFLDQCIDFTKLRPLTFFDKHQVVHTPMAEPFDKKLRKQLIKLAKKLKLSHHPKGTMITIEGPRFSTQAESLMFKKWGADLINMSTIPEVTLANEIGIPYQSIAMVTDYDCWKKNEIPVTFEMILKTMHQNADKVKRLLIEFVATY